MKNEKTFQNNPHWNAFIEYTKSLSTFETFTEAIPYRRPLNGGLSIILNNPLLALNDVHNDHDEIEDVSNSFFCQLNPQALPLQFHL